MRSDFMRYLSITLSMATTCRGLHAKLKENKEREREIRESVYVALLRL